MAGGLVKYRHLSRDSAHRKALLRNLVTSLIEHESITTTWHKAKEAQRLAEKLITLGKRNTVASRQGAQAILFNPFNTAPTLPKDQTRLNKVFTTLRTRYADRPGGYTRVLRVEPQKEDQAPSAILELVDGPKDMRLALTAKTIAHARFKAEQDGRDFKLNDMTAHNVRKVTRYSGMRGEQHLQDLVGKFEALLEQGDEGVEEIKKKRVYPDLQKSR